jgi:hypothetical protein
MQDGGYGFLRIYLLRRWVNKDYNVCLRLLVNEEHTTAKLVR